MTAVVAGPPPPRTCAGPGRHGLGLLRCGSQGHRGERTRKCHPGERTHAAECMGKQGWAGQAEKGMRAGTKEGGDGAERAALRAPGCRRVCPGAWRPAMHGTLCTQHAGALVDTEACALGPPEVSHMAAQQSGGGGGGTRTQCFNYRFGVCRHLATQVASTEIVRRRSDFTDAAGR